MPSRTYRDVRGWLRVEDICHRCGQRCYEGCIEPLPHDHSKWACGYSADIYDVRGCECGESIHKECFKEAVHCPNMTSQHEGGADVD